MLIVCILLALLCAGLAFWVWAQRRSLREAAYRLRALEEVMVRHVQEALDLRLAGVSALMGKVLSA